LDSALESTSQALATTLETLSASLKSTTQRAAQSSQDVTEGGRFFVDVKLHTEAIKDVLDTLHNLRSLRP
jgi:hypothetical protein